MPYLEPFERDRSFIHAPKVLSQALELPGSVPIGPDPPAASANTQSVAFLLLSSYYFSFQKKIFYKRERERKEGRRVIMKVRQGAVVAE